MSSRNKMKSLSPEKLHVKYLNSLTEELTLIPRRYTLTHSDRTGDLFLTIGADYDKKQLEGWQTRSMRDEVLAEWQLEDQQYSLHVFCRVSGGLGPIKYRDAIFRRELPLVLEVIRYGDQKLFNRYPHLDNVSIWVHFLSKKPKYNCVECWGIPNDYFYDR